MSPRRHAPPQDPRLPYPVPADAHPASHEELLHTAAACGTHAACEGDAACLSIWDVGCDGAGDWRTCRSATGGSSSSGSCLYVKP